MIIAPFIVLCILFWSLKGGLGLHNYDIISLIKLEDYLCAFSRDDTLGGYHPFYCVPKDYCDNVTIPVSKFIFDCKRIPAKSDTCCHIKHITNDIYKFYPLFAGVQDFMLLIKDWAVRWDLSKKSLSYFYQDEYLHSVPAGVHEALDGNAICALVPAGSTSRGQHLYIPYICWHLDCHFSIPREYKENRAWNSSNQWEYSLSGERFCSDYIFNRFCCHPSVALKSEHILQRKNQKEWSLKILSPHQKYAVGFRASFQCEQYSRLVCDETHDLCPLRVLDQDTADVPTTYSFQALIGIDLRRTREFICGGALVSRLFILSAHDCEQYNGLPVTIALIGEYDTTEFNERGPGRDQREIMTYLSEIYEENYDDLGGYKVALFRLWRPVTLTQRTKPACLDWKANFRSPIRQPGKYEEMFPTGYRLPFYNHTITNEQGDTIPLYEYVPRGFILPKELIFSGFGSTTSHRGLNRTLKRIPLAFRYEAQKPQLVKECQTSFSKSAVKKIPSILCNAPASRPNNTIVEGPCEFDLGSPATTGERDQAPYCMRKVGGVAITVRYDCDKENVTPTLFKNTNFLMAWMEEVIWRNDFHLAAANIATLPSCHDEVERSFRDLMHIRATGWRAPPREKSSEDTAPPELDVEAVPDFNLTVADEQIRKWIGNRLFNVLETEDDTHSIAADVVASNLTEREKTHLILKLLDLQFEKDNDVLNRCIWQDLNGWWRVYKECLRNENKPKNKKPK